MNRFISRLIVSGAFVVGGFLAMAGVSAVAEDLPTAPSQVAPARTNLEEVATVDLAGWQQTRLIVKTSNVIPTPTRPIKK